MADLSGLYKERSRYQKLNSTIESTINEINNSINSINPAVSGINQSYLIDNIPAENNKIKTIGTDLSNKVGQLRGVISASNERIAELSREIEEEERRLEEERRRQRENG